MPGFFFVGHDGQRAEARSCGGGGRQIDGAGVIEAGVVEGAQGSYGGHWLRTRWTCFVGHASGAQWSVSDRPSTREFSRGCFLVEEGGAMELSDVRQ